MKVRAWYGLYGSIDLDEVLWHRVEVGGIWLAHPAIVNLFLRRGLSRPRRRRLSFLHELGHL